MDKRIISSKKTVDETNDHIGLYPANRPPAPEKTGGGIADDIVPLIYILTIGEGEGELHADLDHPLARPIKKAATTGKPAGPWHYLCVRHLDGSPPTVLGALMLTVDERILFYPGASIEYTRSDELGRFAGRELDHVTLEKKTRHRWRSHTTLRQGNRRSRHGLANTATEKTGELLPWLTMFVPDLSIFHTLPAKLKISLDWPSSDVVRYTQEAVGCHYRKRAIVDAPPEPVGEGFWQVDFFIGQGRSWKGASYAPLRYLDAPHILSYDDEGNKTRTAGHIVSEQTPEIGVVVIITRPSGSLHQSCFLTPPDNWMESGD